MQRLSVAALFGAPGGSAVIEQRWFARGAGPWRADGAPLVPAIDGKIVRKRQEEAAARDAAVEFMSDAARADYDAAWARTSMPVLACRARTLSQPELEGASHHAPSITDPAVALFAWFAAGLLTGLFAIVPLVREKKEWLDRSLRSAPAATPAS